MVCWPSLLHAMKYEALDFDAFECSVPLLLHSAEAATGVENDTFTSTFSFMKSVDSFELGVSALCGVEPDVLPHRTPFGALFAAVTAAAPYVIDAPPGTS